MLQSQKMRSPFSLLEDDNQIPHFVQKNFERQRIDYKSSKKSNTLPFAKYQIKHEAKTVKSETNIKNEILQKQKITQSLKNKQQNLHPSGTQPTQQISTKQSNPKNSQQQRSQVEIPANDNSQSIAESQYSEEDEEKKYFLTKKHRQIKYELNADGDPPLLYDIGLDAQMIKDKLKLVMKLGEPDYDMIMNPDLAGPVLIAFTFGFLLLFSGQIHFGDIYALFIIGNLFMFMLFNFMAQKGVISLYNIMSILGYCLMPMLTLGMTGIFLRLNTGFGLMLGLMISLWSSVAAGNFIEALIRGKNNRKVLIIYPLFLFYASFAMIVIF